MAGRLRKVSIVFLVLVPVQAAEHRGVVRFGGQPVPGASVTARFAAARLTAVTDGFGRYLFTDLADGVWSITVEMQCFVPLERAVVVRPNVPEMAWDLALLPRAEVRAQREAAATPEAPERLQEIGLGELGPARNAGAQTEDQPIELERFLINGSANNSLDSTVAQPDAFGNFRSRRGAYHGSLGMAVDSSELDAAPYSLTGTSTRTPAHMLTTGRAAFGGPLQLPHLWEESDAPRFIVSYERTRNTMASAAHGRMPDAFERSGNLSRATAAPVIDPATATPVPGRVIPASRISPQAKALLSLFRAPELDAQSGYNLQVPLMISSHQDALKLSALHSTSGNYVAGHFSFDSTREDNPTLPGFLDRNHSHGLSAAVAWAGNLTSRWQSRIGVTLNRRSASVLPYFSNRLNVSGNAGITGNNQEPVNWGPPDLFFSSGITGLSDVRYLRTRKQTLTVSYAGDWVHRAHNLHFGADYSRQQRNVLGQHNPRGAFVFTGAATGVDFADFLFGIPDTSSIAFGNADKYFRGGLSAAYVTDDWRAAPGITVNAGVRWEYAAPLTERYGRLVNLDLAPGFAGAAPVIAYHPIGQLTAARYPRPLLHPYRRMFEPRVAVAWIPLAGSSMVVRAGYGIYADTGVYDAIASQMAQQSPISKSLTVQNSAAHPLTLANGFCAAGGLALSTFAVDPGFRPAYAQNWQLSIERDLPWGLAGKAVYLGIKGTHALQAIYPNTYPAGAAGQCPGCPSGFEYLLSGGNSTRHAGRFQMRRRLHRGLSASFQITWAKAIDNAGFERGAEDALVAQNWLDLASERALSDFDQRRQIGAVFQYTTGAGMTGWRGRLYREWTLSSEMTAGSGLPLSPVYFAAVSGTGFTGNLRPDYTGAHLYAAPPGLALNPAAYRPPTPGRWGNAGRNSITGPAQFSWNASLARSFPLGDRMGGDLRVDASNLLNHMTYTAWDTTLDSALFGRPVAANSMRTIRANLILRF